jgi:hypothetical protein
MYVDRVSYSEDTTVYANYWKAFYDDQFDVNTKKVTCYVKLDRVNQDMMRKFYYFDNSIWILNKIDSFDITSYGTTRCEFIKVQDMQNYTRGVKDYSSRFSLSGELNPNGGTTTLRLDSTFDWNVYSHTFSSLTPTSGGPGVTDIKVSYTPNTTIGIKIYQVEFTTSDSSLHRSFVLQQKPNPETTINLKINITGYPTGARLYIEQASGNTSSILLSRTDYSIYVQKNAPIRLYVTQGTETYYDCSFGGYSEDAVININI